MPIQGVGPAESYSEHLSFRLAWPPLQGVSGWQQAQHISCPLTVTPSRTGEYNIGDVATVPQAVQTSVHGLHLRGKIPIQAGSLKCLRLLVDHGLDSTDERFGGVRNERNAGYMLMVSSILTFAQNCRADRWVDTTFLLGFPTSSVTSEAVCRSLYHMLRVIIITLRLHYIRDTSFSQSANPRFLIGMCFYLDTPNECGSGEFSSVRREMQPGLRGLMNDRSTYQLSRHPGLVTFGGGNTCFLQIGRRLPSAAQLESPRKKVAFLLHRVIRAHTEVVPLSRWPCCRLVLSSLTRRSDIHSWPHPICVDRWSTLHAIDSCG